MEIARGQKNMRTIVFVQIKRIKKTNTFNTTGWRPFFGVKYHIFPHSISTIPILIFWYLHVFGKI